MTVRVMLASIRDFALSFLKQQGLPPSKARISPLAGDGSSRSFWRLTINGFSQSFVIMANPPETEEAKKENRAYFMIGRHLRRKQLPVPKIFAWNTELGSFILEDLGDTDLQSYVLGIEDPVEIYSVVIRHLVRMQIHGVKDFDTNWCCQTKRYDSQVVLKYESQYFKDAFLGLYMNFDSDISHLDDVFRYLAKKASKAKNNFLMHRDFQSRNIMVRTGDIWILDWQGARLGPLAYDLASLLIDPYVNLAQQTRNRLFSIYLDLLRGINQDLAEEVNLTYPYLALQRNLQIIGAFSYLTKVKRKAHFRQYIIPAIGSLRALLKWISDPELGALLELVEGLHVGNNLP